MKPRRDGRDSRAAWATVTALVCAIALGACGTAQSPPSTGATDVATDTPADGAVDSAGDSAMDAAADTALDAGADAAVDAIKDGVVDTAVDSAVEVAVDSAVDAATDTAISTDTPATDAKDVSADTGLCPLPQPPGTVCQGSSWMCAPGYFHGFGKTECLEATCDNMAKVLKESIDAAVAKSHSCTGAEDGECMVVATSTACQGTCGMAVNSGMANDVALVVGWVDDHICKEFGYAAKCGYSTPKCMAPKPFCSGGTCAYAP